MIAAAFLIAALAPAPMAMAHADCPGAIKAHRLMIDASRMMAKKETKAQILLIGGPPKAVTTFRNAGVQAFGALVDDYPGVTPFHAVMEAGHLAFQSGTFHLVYWSQSNPMAETMFQELLDALRLVEAGGLFLFDDNEYPYWPGYMKGRNWVRVCFRLAQFSVWERRISDDTFKKNRRIGASA
jgi:hypothetical protein